MSLGVISPIRNKGLYSDWLSAAPLATSMLTIDTSGNVGSQAIPVAAWGSITGTLSSQTDLQNALNAKLSLSGGTLTGALSGTSATFSGALRLPTNDTGIYFSASGNSSPRISVFSNSLFIDANGSPGDIYFRSNNSTHTNLKLYPGSNPVSAEFNSSISFGGTDCVITRDAADTLALRRSTNAQRFNLYGTYTDASNYIRQSLSFTTYSSTVHARISAEGAGTGAVNVPFVITPRGTGAFIVGPMPDGTATGGNARGANAIDLQTTRGSASHVASGTRAVAIGTSCTASAVNTIAIGRATASGGSSLAIGTDGATASGAGSIAIGFDSITASNNCSIAIGASGATSSGECAIALGSGTASRSNEVAWGFRHTAFDVRPGAFLLSATTTNATATALQLRNVFSSSNFTTRSGVVLHGTLHVTGVKSDGSAVAVYTRRIVLKNVGGVITLVESQTIGTDYEDNAATDLTISNASPFFQVTGIASETWRWVGWFSPTCEIAYGT
jgi:hypothetical protein